MQAKGPPGGPGYSTGRNKNVRNIIPRGQTVPGSVSSQRQKLVQSNTGKINRGSGSDSIPGQRADGGPSKGKRVK